MMPRRHHHSRKGTPIYQLFTLDLINFIQMSAFKQGLALPAYG